MLQLFKRRESLSTAYLSVMSCFDVMFPFTVHAHHEKEQALTDMPKRKPVLLQT